MTYIVDVDAEVDGTSEAQILSCSPDRTIREEEGHGKQSTNGHRVLPAKHMPVAHEASQDRSKDTTCVRDEVVAPRVVWRVFAGFCASSCQEFREEDVELAQG